MHVPVEPLLFVLGDHRMDTDSDLANCFSKFRFIGDAGNSRSRKLRNAYTMSADITRRTVRVASREWLRASDPTVQTGFICSTIALALPTRL